MSDTYAHTHTPRSILGRSFLTYHDSRKVFPTIILIRILQKIINRCYCFEISKIEIRLKSLFLPKIHFSAHQESIYHNMLI